MPITDQKSSFLTLLLKSIHDWNIRLPRFVLSWFFFHGMVRNGIPRVYLYFLLHGKEFRVLFSSSERNSQNLHLFLFHGTEFRVIASSAEGFGTEFRDFLFRGTTGIPSEIAICSVYSVFRGIIFLSEIPNPSHTIYACRVLSLDSSF